MLLKAKQAAAELGVSLGTLRGLVADGEIPKINVGRGSIRPALRFDLKEIQRFKQARETRSKRNGWEGIS